MNSKKESGLERMIKIEVKKHPEPFITPSMCREGVSSVRNPGAIKHKGEYILLCTIRSSDNISRLHLARSSDGNNFKVDRNPFINTDKDSIKGVEDPRITKISDEYYIVYTLFKGVKKDIKRRTVNTTRIGMVKTRDFKNYYDKKILLDKWGDNKNGVIFQNENTGEFYVIHRPFLGKAKEKPSAYLARTKDFERWENMGIFLSPRKKMWDSARVGINTPPIKMEEGLLFLYHGADKKKNVYKIGYVLKDPKNPIKTLYRSPEAIIKPEYGWETGECDGGAEIPMVVFGQGIVDTGKDSWEFFYGGGDRYIGKADMRITRN